jgi:hypothetical protein
VTGAPATTVDLHVEAVLGFSFAAGRLPVNETPSSSPSPDQPPSEKPKEFRWSMTEADAI